MKATIKYILILFLSFFSVFYKNENLNIILLIPLIAFCMSNGIKYFLFSIIGTVIGGVFYYKINDEYTYLMYSLIALSIYFLIYHLCMLFNKKIIINFFVSILFSLLITYSIYIYYFNIYDYKTIVYLLITCILISFIFSFLFKNFSLYLFVYEDKTALITSTFLLCMYLSNINSIIINNKILYYCSLFFILLSLYNFILKNNYINSFAILTITLIASFIFKCEIIYNNYLLILLSTTLLILLKCKLRLLNSILIFASFIIVLLYNQKHISIEYLCFCFITAISLLFIKYSKNDDKIDSYYNQYINNKNDIISYLENIENMFISIGNNFKNSYINSILRKSKDEVFDTLCNGCEKLTQCHKNNKHLLLNYIKDLINNSLDDKKINDIKNNCIRQEGYFKLLDKFTTTYLINNYKNEEKSLLKEIVSSDFINFSKVINQCKKQLLDDRLNKINTFYKKLKDILKENNYDVLFVKNLSNESMYKFDIAIKNISRKKINETLIPIVNKLLNCYMKVLKIDTATLTFSYLIITIVEIEKLNISFAYRQSNEDFNANGDSIDLFESDKQFYISLSDGMGNGICANEESKFTLDTLFSMIKTKMDVKSSIITCNDLIRLKNEPETYTTLDFLAINKYSHIASFYKFGAINSFIIRDHIVNQVNNYSLPLGIIDDVFVSPNSYKLKKKDVIILCSDGLIDDNSDVLSILENVSYDNPTIICNTLFSQLLNIRKNIDDATLIVITIN